MINFTGVTISGLPPLPQRDTVPANGSVLIAAPDNPLDATGPGNGPYTAWGFYSDTAWVAGTVALIKAVYPHITPGQVARALAESAKFRPPGGYNTTVGFGLINPVGALHDAGALVRLGTSSASGPGTVSATARFGTTQPVVIDAVHHARARLVEFGAAIVVGLVLLLLALILGLWRRRRRRRAAVRATTNLATTNMASTVRPSTVPPGTVPPSSESPPADLAQLEPPG